MHILANPISNENTASSRIRCYRFLQYMGKEHLISIIKPKTTRRVDLYYVQKNAYIQTVKEAAEYRMNSIPVVYDIDDDFGVWPDMYEKSMLEIAHAITTDTIERKIYLENYTNKPVYVIPDAVDYVSQNESPVILRNKIEVVGTFGVTDIFKPYLESIYGRYKIYYISTPIPSLSAFARLDWKLDTFINTLKEFDVCVLIHPNDNKGNMKSNNRLLVCMAIGLPCIVSNTPAYVNTMKEIGLDMLIAKQPSDVPIILDRLQDPTVRLEISDKFIQYAWNNYSPQRSSKTLEDLFKYLVGKICA